MEITLLAVCVIAILALGVISTFHLSFASNEVKTYHGIISINLSGDMVTRDTTVRRHAVSGEINVAYAFSDSQKTMAFSIDQDSPNSIVVDSKQFDIPFDAVVRATAQSFTIEAQELDFGMNAMFFFPETFLTISKIGQTDAITPSKITVTSGGEKFVINTFTKMTAQVQVLKVGIETSYVLDELRQHALKQINADRENPGPKQNCQTTTFGTYERQICSPIIEVPTIRMVCDKDFYNCRTESSKSGGKVPPVELSDNGAAQALAEDILKERYLSFWSSNGEKPYMTYTKYGGLGDVESSIAWTYYPDESIAECNLWLSTCPRLDPLEEIDSLEHLLTYTDVEGSWVNRDIILDKYHTHVSIGIAYDDYHVVLVLNFENNYASYDQLPYLDSRNRVNIEADLSSTKLNSFSINRDPLPSRSEYENSKLNDLVYDFGEMVANVVEPAGEGYYYEQPQDYVLIEASRWEIDGTHVDVIFDISPVLKRDSVYTVVMWLEADGLLFPGSSYSFFVD